MLPARSLRRRFSPALLLGSLILCSGCAAASTTEPSAPQEAPSAVEAEAAPTQESSRTGAEAAGPQIPVVEATPRAEAVDPPVSVDYPGIGASMPVQPTGVQEDGQMEIPPDAATAGWYRYSATPVDADGTTVIAAHNASPETLDGPLNSLKEARIGDEVRLSTESGVEVTYHVSAVENLGKDGLDLSPYFTRAGDHGLVLITCGGQWLPEQSTYSDNVVVTAQPAD